MQDIYHILFATLTLILSYSLYAFYLFGRDVSEQAHIATNPKIIQKLDGPLQQTTFKKAAKIMHGLYYFIAPLASISIVITLTAWFYVGMLQNTLFGFSVYGPTIISLYIIIVLNYDTDPPWLEHWENIHELTMQQLYVEFIEVRLNELKQLLIDSQNGTIFDKQQLIDIKLESLVLSQEAFLINGDINSAKNIQPLIDSLNIP